MHFANHGLKPCSKCLKARQAAKDVANKVFNRYQEKYLKVECTHYTLVLVSETRTVVSCTDTRMSPTLVGIAVYLAGTRVYDLASAKPIYWLGTIVKITPFD